jgi:hypothetical protein
MSLLGVMLLAPIWLMLFFIHAIFLVLILFTGKR